MCASLKNALKRKTHNYAYFKGDTMKDLLPCPFCGGEGDIVQSVPGYWVAYCTNPKCVVRGYYATEEIAIAAWNTRHHFGLTDEDYNILLDEMGVSERTCHIEHPYYGDAPVINGQPRCSECKAEFEVGTFPHYCPNCGAKVVKE